jgi:hypothetical protein
MQRSAIDGREALDPISEGDAASRPRRAVGLRRVGSGAEVAKLAQPAGFGEDPGDVARNVVGHDALDADAAVAEPAAGADEKAARRGAALVLEDLDIGEPRGVVDGDVDDVPAGTAALAAAAAVDTPPRSADRVPLRNRSKGRLAFDVRRSRNGPAS